MIWRVVCRNRGFEVQTVPIGILAVVAVVARIAQCPPVRAKSKLKKTLWKTPDLQRLRRTRLWTVVNDDVLDYFRGNVVTFFFAYFRSGPECTVFTVF